MPDAGDLLSIIKKAAVEAVEASRPAAVVCGTVISTEPLKIKVSQKITLSASQLICMITEKALKKNDSCLLLRKQGGQEYVVLGVVA